MHDSGLATSRQKATRGAPMAPKSTVAPSPLVNIPSNLAYRPKAVRRKLLVTPWHKEARERVRTRGLRHVPKEAASCREPAAHIERCAAGVVPVSGSARGRRAKNLGAQSKRCADSTKLAVAAFRLPAAERPVATVRPRDQNARVLSHPGPGPDSPGADLLEAPLLDDASDVRSGSKRASDNPLPKRLQLRISDAADS